MSVRTLSDKEHKQTNRFKTVEAASGSETVILGEDDFNDWERRILFNRLPANFDLTANSPYIGTDGVNIYNFTQTSDEPWDNKLALTYCVPIQGHAKIDILGYPEGGGQYGGQGGKFVIHHETSNYQELVETNNSTSIQYTRYVNFQECFTAGTAGENEMEPDWFNWHTSYQGDTVYAIRIRKSVVTQRYGNLSWKIGDSFYAFQTHRNTPYGYYGFEGVKNTVIERHSGGPIEVPYGSKFYIIGVEDVVIAEQESIVLMVSLTQNGPPIPCYASGGSPTYAGVLLPYLPYTISVFPYAGYTLSTIKVFDDAVRFATWRSNYLMQEIEFYSKSLLDFRMKEVGGYPTGSLLNRLAFKSCYSLREVTLSTSFSPYSTESMFSNCRSLKKAPIVNMNRNTDASYMFSECTSLIEAFIQPECPNLYNTSGMFQGAINLRYVSYFDTSQVQNADYMFDQCNQLQSIPEFNFSSVQAGGSSPFGGNFLLANGFMSNYNTNSVWIGNQNRGVKSLERVFELLPAKTVEDGATISIGSNPGAATCDITVAVNKNWTVYRD